MPAIGNLCPADSGRPVEYEYCLNICSNKCLPLPLLLTLMRQREVVSGVYSTTTILNPPKVVYLQRNSEYFVNPLASIFASFGTGLHSMLEDGAAYAKEIGLGDHLVIEKPFRIQLETPSGSATLTGRPDMYDAESKILWDYKSSKAYSVLKAKAGDFGTYAAQLQTYRAFGFPEAEHQKLCFLIKDHSSQVAARDGLAPVEIMDVPIIEIETVKKSVVGLLDLHLKCQDHPNLLRDCTDEERWVTKSGEPRRCQDYCPQGTRCTQWLADQERLEHKAAAPKRSPRMKKAS